MISGTNRYYRNEWITLLEKGTLPQVQFRMSGPVPGDLVDEDGDPKIGYCCLGVAEYSTGNRAVFSENTDEWMINGQYSRMSAETAFRMGFLELNPFLWVIPQEVELRIREYETSNTSVFPVPRTSIALSFLNDRLGMTFPEIAKALRAQPDHWTGVCLAGPAE